MTAAGEKPHKFNCPTCRDTGVIVPPRNVRQTYIDGKIVERPISPARALPLPCSFCAAGEIELEVENRVAKLRRAYGSTGGEIEIFRFRQAKG